MRWFKHLSASSAEEFLSELEATFGLDGYARWMKLLEAVAARMEPGDAAAIARYPWSEWQRILRGKRKQLTSFLEHLENKRQIKVKDDGQVLEIEIPILLKLRDEYSKKSGVSPDKIRSKRQRQRTEAETDASLDSEIPAGAPF